MRLAAVFFASFLAFAAASGYQRLQSGGYYAWKSKCVGFELVKGVSGEEKLQTQRALPTEKVCLDGSRRFRGYQWPN